MPARPQLSFSHLGIYVRDLAGMEAFYTGLLGFTVTDRGDYVHVHTLMDCRLTRDSLQRCLGRDFDLARLEIDMPSFAGRLRTTDGEFRWYYSH